MTRLEAEAVIRDLKQHFSATSNAAVQDSVDSARRKIREKINELNPLEPSGAAIAYETDPVAKIVKGAVVQVANLGQRAWCFPLKGNR